MTNLFKEKFGQDRQLFTLELTIPKGTNISSVVQKAYLLKDCIDAFNVPSNPRSILKVGALSVSHILKELSLEPILHLTCKNKNKLALQEEVLSAYVLGIKNILALTGDPPSCGDHPDATEINDFDSYALIKTINSLNGGNDANSNPLNKKTDVFVGGALNPNDFRENPEIVFAKLNCGANFFQTQLVYDLDFFKEFLKAIGKYRKNVLVGLMPLKSAKTAHYLNEKVPGVTVPQEIIRRIEQSKVQEREGIEITKEFIAELNGKCRGFHLMPLGREEIALELFQKEPDTLLSELLKLKRRDVRAQPL